MKQLFKIVGVIAMVLLLNSCIVVSKRSNSGYFDAYNAKGAEFTSINLPVYLIKPFIGKTLYQDEDRQEVENVLKKISKVKVTTVQNVNKAMLHDYTQYLKRNNFTDWVSINRDGQRINIQAQQKGDDIRKLMLVVSGSEEMVFIDIKGLFKPDDISRMINSVDTDSK